MRTAVVKQKRPPGYRDSDLESVHATRTPTPDHSSSISSLQRTAGNRAVGQFLQAKLAISSPGDVSEQEADRVADQVMRMPEPTVQRKCAACGAGDSPWPKCETEQSGILDRKADAASGPSASSDAATLIPHRGSGHPLDPGTRSFFEPRLGYDLSSVRIHTGSPAAESARAIDAKAYTLGNNVVFGSGQYQPETAAGKQLLAHELAHVVQQRSGACAPMLQRRLLVTGNKADVKAMLGLLEPASGFTLKYDPKTNAVSVTASVLKPPSFVLASKLATIMDDPKQDAEIHLGRKQEGVNVGAFPDDLDKKAVQEIRIDHVLALEKGAPGSGVAKLAHEIVENYEAHALKDFNRNVAFEVSHEKALETENLIERELGHPGSRRNTFSVVIDPGKGKRRRFLREIEDREKYFLVSDQSFDTKGTVSNARRVPRVKVSTYKIDGFTAGSSTPPKTSVATITALVADMKGNPTASALVEGFAAAGGTSNKNLELATGWAEMVRDRVIDQVGDILNTNWRRFHVAGSDDRARNCVVVTLERPDI